jgi:hypothetical protein
VGIPRSVENEECGVAITTNPNELAYNFTASQHVRYINPHKLPGNKTDEI